MQKELICCIWSDDEFVEDRKIAFEIFDDFRKPSSQGVTLRNTTHQRANPTYNTPNNLNSNRQIANEVAKRFSINYMKFSGDTTDCWPKFLETYSRMSAEMELTEALQMKLFNHLLKDHALEFYRDNVEGNYASYSEIVKVMNDEYC